MSAALREAGYTVPPSQANFVWLPLPGARTGIRQTVAANSRIIVRPYGEDGVRVTVAAGHENDAFLEFAEGKDDRMRSLGPRPKQGTRHERGRT